MDNRNHMVDIAKGIGILLVVFGHNPLVLDPRGELYNVIFSFHIPLFFFLSGLFFNPSKSFINTFLQKCDSLLKPYFVTLFTIGLAYMLFFNSDLVSYIFHMAYGNGKTIIWVPLWFLPHLFAVILFSWVLINLLGNKTKIFQIKMLVLIILLLAGFNTITFFWLYKIKFFNNTYILPGLPFSFDIILITTFFYLQGHFFSHSVSNFKPLISAFLICCLLFAGCHYLFNLTMDLNLRIYDGLVIPTIESICGIYIVLSISYHVQSNSVMTKAFSVFSEASLIILIFHTFFQDRTLTIASAIIGKNAFSALFAFIIGSAFPVLIWFLIKKSDFLSLFYLPLKPRHV